MPGKKKPGPSVKDPKVYEEIRETRRIKGQGGSDRQCSGGTLQSSVGNKGGKSGSYEDWTVDDLRKLAKELGLSGYSGKHKSELVSTLRNH
jgi:hypothetical protein